MRTTADVMREIEVEVTTARGRLEEIVKSDEEAMVAARLLKMDAGMMVRLLDELVMLREKEVAEHPRQRVMLLESLRRANDHTMDEEGDDDL